MVVGETTSTIKRRTSMTLLGDLELKDAAKHAAGNWKNFKCFVWYRDRELTKPEDWSVVYTHNRDSGLLDQSNAAVGQPWRKSSCRLPQTTTRGRLSRALAPEGVPLLNPLLRPLLGHPGSTRSSKDSSPCLLATCGHDRPVNVRLWTRFHNLVMASLGSSSSRYAPIGAAPACHGCRFSRFGEAPAASC